MLLSRRSLLFDTLAWLTSSHDVPCSLAQPASLSTKRNICHPVLEPGRLSFVAVSVAGSTYMKADPATETATKGATLKFKYGVHVLILPEVMQIVKGL